MLPVGRMCYNTVTARDTNKRKLPIKPKRKEKQIMEVLAEKKPIEEQVDCNIDINIFC